MSKGKFNCFHLFILSLTVNINFIFSDEEPESKMYDYNNLLKQQPKVSIDFIFDKEEFLQSNGDNFDKYFFKFYETEMPLSTGAKMLCEIPTKINLYPNYTPINNLSLIYNLSEYYANIYLRQVHSMCYSTSIDKWFYKICPRKVAIQTLSYKKLNQVTKEYEIEINYLGYSKNDTKDEDLNERNQNLYMNSFKENNLDSIAVNGNIIKILNSPCNIPIGENVYPIRKEKNKYYLSIVYDINELKKIDNYLSIKVSKYVKDIQSLIENSISDLSHITLVRKIKYFINKNIFVIKGSLPEGVNCISHNIFTAPRINAVEDDEFYFNTYELINLGNTDMDHVLGDKIKFYNLDFKNIGRLIILDNKYVYCNNCSFVPCINLNCYIFAIYFKVYSKIVQVYEENFAKISDDFINYNNLYIANDILITQNEGLHLVNEEFSIKDRLLIINKPLNFKKMFYQVTDYILFIKKVTFGNDFLDLDSLNINDYQSYFSESNFIKCKIEKVISDSIILLSKECSFLSDKEIISKIKNDAFIIINSNQNSKFNKCYDKETFTIISPNKIAQEPNQISFLKTSFNYSNNFNYSFPINNKEGQFQISMKLITKNAHAYAHFYLTKNIQEVTDKDYEIIINKNNGIIIKQVGNESLITFYLTNKMSLFTDQTQLDIIYSNSCLYINTNDKESNETSIKLKFLLAENYFSNNNFFIVDSRLTKNLKLKNIQIFSNIIQEKVLDNVFLYNLKYLFADNITFSETYVNGDYCDAIKNNRTTKITYTCDETGMNDLIISDVKEEKICEYSYLVKSKFLCNPDYVLKNSNKFMDSNVNCFTGNEVYNHNIEEYFE